MAGAIICRSLADILSGPVALHSLEGLQSEDHLLYTFILIVGELSG